jgi:crotonobetainyl-CoA:carnitine CoA-transferase CaiB-like acyl-CoA transferase
VAALEAAGVPCSAYGEPGDALADPHLVERGLFGRIADAAGRVHRRQPAVADVGSRAELRRRIPAVGADRDAVLADWLAATPTRSTLARRGVFGRG